MAPNPADALLYNICSFYSSSLPMESMASGNPQTQTAEPTDWQDLKDRLEPLVRNARTPDQFHKLEGLLAVGPGHNFITVCPFLLYMNPAELEYLPHLHQNQVEAELQKLEDSAAKLVGGRRPPFVDDTLEEQGEATRAAWKIPYEGHAHELLAAAIKEAHVESHGVPYTSFFPIIQSSGMGKSRTIDEVAKAHFTIPFNIRDDDREHAYPLPDSRVRDYFVSFPTGTRHETSGDFLLFFSQIFTAVNQELEQHREWGPSLPKRWHQHLRTPGPARRTARQRIYETAINKARELRWELKAEALRRKRSTSSRKSATHGSKPRAGDETMCDIEQIPISSELGSSEGIRTSDSDVGQKKVHNTTDNAKISWFREVTVPIAQEALRKLRATIDTFGVARGDMPAVLMYFDESHVLLDRPCSDDTNDPSTQFDVLCSALNILGGTSLFSVFLSTNSSLGRHALTWAKLPSARGMTKSLRAPFTELPFDCHPSFPLFRGQQVCDQFRPLTLEKICSTEFMCTFGRPLFWTRCDKLPSYLHEQIFEFAGSKLTCSNRNTDFKCFYSKDPDSEAQGKYDGRFLSDGAASRLAVLDLRILLDFEPHRESILSTVESRLVERHMRVVFSFSSNGEHRISGYPSEPVLAEAAARLMERLRKAHNDGNTDVIPQILQRYTENGLISKGKRGKMVARLLLISAYDYAHDDMAIGPLTERYSTPISVAQFLRALLGPHWDQVRACRPDNLPSDVTLEEAFKHAKVRFTHFNRAWDDHGSTTHMAMAAFLRAMGIQCCSNQEGIDIVIPVYFESDDPHQPRQISRKYFSGLLCSIKNRSMPSSHTKVAVDESKIGFFPPLSDETDLLPYVVIVMELGIQSPSTRPAPSGSSDKSEAPNLKSNPLKRDLSGQEDHTDAKRNKTSNSPAPSTIDPQLGSPASRSPVSSMPSKIDLAPGPTRASARYQNIKHPRYTIYVYGCSPTVYPNVVKNKDVYAFLLGCRTFITEHPRQKEPYIKALKSLKPVWTGEAECFSWLDKSMGEANEQLEEGVVVGVLEEEDISDNDLFSS